jgi:glycosyltransferase involved in cell wall biosynthesis
MNRTDEQPAVLFVSTVDIVVRMMIPQLDALRRAGCTVDIACHMTRHAEELAAHADALHEIPFSRSPVHPQNVAATVRLISLLRRRTYALVHAHTPVGGIAGRLAATMAGRGGRRPIRLYTAHGFHFHRHGGRLSNAVYRGAEVLAGRLLSDAVMTINREDYDAAIQARLVRPPSRVLLTAGVGVSTDVFDLACVSAADRAARRREFGAESDATPVVTFIGEMIPRKRHGDALAAFARIRASRPDALLVLVGEGVLRERVERHAEELGVAPACRFLGFRRDIPAILAASDLFLFPTAQEGLPCAVQEALAMGLPVVGADVRGTRDLVSDDCGRLAPLGDVAALADACLDILALPLEKRRALGAAGRARMIDTYDRSQCVNEWMAIYGELLAERGLVLHGDDGRRNAVNASCSDSTAFVSLAGGSNDGSGGADNACLSATPRSGAVAS